MTVRSSAVAIARETAFAPAQGHAAYCAGVAGGAMPMPAGAPAVQAGGETRVTVETTGAVAMRGRRMRAPIG